MMYQQIYAETVTNSPKAAREIERKLLESAIRKLAVAKARGPESPESLDATSFLRDIWGAFMRDLANEENALPSSLRASLISIGLWIGREVDLLDAGRSSNYDALIEINQIIADGLS